MRIGILLLAFAFNSAAWADSTGSVLNADVAAIDKAATKDGWQGSVGLGFLSTTGNSDTSSLNANVALGYKSGPWGDTLSLQALHASQNGLTTAESYDATGQSKYSFSEKNYVFGLLDYLSDRFSGYRRRTTEAFGYGRRLLDSDAQQLDVEFGLGVRQTRYTDNTSSSVLIERLSGSYLWKFADKSNFSQNLSVEHGSDNTYTQSVTALTTNLAGSFALSMSYTVKHNSTVLPGFKNTDTITAVSLVYSF
jgi:putative salt-induced outer membrane protein